MYLKKQSTIIDKKNPFLHDKLERKESAEILTPLIKSVDQPFVLSISSGWGTGKTTFIKMWEQHLVNLKFPCIYFNAWETQFSQDPLISFIGEINSQITKLLGDDDIAKISFEKIKNITGKLAKRALPGVIKLATYGVLDLSELTENTIAELMTDITKDNIKSYEESKQTIEEFKKLLSDFVIELSRNNKYNKLPLVFLIDELDRCNPTYGINL